MTLDLRRICLVGVRGIGKSTAVRGVIDALPLVDHVVGSAVLRELAGEAFARFDHLPPPEKQRYRERAIDWMEDRQRREQRHVLCDGHTALLDESTGSVGSVFTLRDCAFFRELILLEGPVELVLQRRIADPSKRRSVDAAVVVAEIAAERETSRELADRYGMRLHRVQVDDDVVLRRRLVELLS